MELQNPTKESRVLLPFESMVAMRRLQPRAAENSVHHRDVSCSNLMYYTDKDGKLIGVLNDFDLASLATSPGPLGNERTGTIPFMARDLLSAEAFCGELEHRYRHDLESFVWVLVWICMCYKNDALRGGLVNWVGGQERMPCSASEQSAFIIRYPYQDLPREVDTECWNVANDDLMMLLNERTQRSNWIHEAKSGRAGFREEEKWVNVLN